jgi:hypothetical protein
MSNATDFLSSDLDSHLLPELDGSTVADDFLNGELGAPADNSPIVKFEGTDPRLKLLSHSSRLTLHSCPRKYELYRLNSKEIDFDDGGAQRTTFDFGTAVGIGVQDCLEGKSEDQAIFNMAMAWEGDLLNENAKQKKSFWRAVVALRRFYSIREQGYLEDYELVYYQGKPAVELSFRITLPDGYKYRGYVDAVLRHKETGAILVLECKTTSVKEPNPANFRNSGQAIGYSVVLDAIFPELNTYTVLYLVYSTSSTEYIEFQFDKNLYQRALWLQELMIDKEVIDLYESVSTYPMHGESCFAWYRECEYLGICTMSNDKLVKPLTEKQLTKMNEEEYMFEVDFFTLVESQLELGGL